MDVPWLLTIQLLGDPGYHGLPQKNRTAEADLGPQLFAALRSTSEVAF